MSLKSDLGVFVISSSFFTHESRSPFFVFFSSSSRTMKLIILNDYDLASEWAAKYIRNRILQFGPGPDRYFTLGLPTGE